MRKIFNQNQGKRNKRNDRPVPYFNDMFQRYKGNGNAGKCRKEGRPGSDFSDAFTGKSPQSLANTAKECVSKVFQRTLHQIEMNTFKQQIGCNKSLLVFVIKYCGIVSHTFYTGSIF